MRTWKVFDRTMFGAQVRNAIHCTSLLLFFYAAPLCAQPAPYTPVPGSTERNAIFDALRTLGDNHTRVFVVRYLKVQNGWAWVTGDPQSPDGKSHFETESALLRNDGTGWKVLDQPCSEGDCDPAKEIARIRAAYPDAPARIFPP
jgi:hypothetical protein